MAVRIRATADFLKKGALSPLFIIPGLSFLGVERGKGPINGEQWILSFQSACSNDPSKPSPAEVAYRLVVGDFSAALRAIGPTHELTVRTPDDPSGAVPGEVSRTYELLGNSIQLDLREHPKSLALGPEVITVIDKVLSGATKDDGKTLYASSDITAAAGATNSADAMTLYDLLRQRNGNAAVTKSQFVFRFTRVASNRATIDVGYANVGKILTTDQMVFETGGPIGILASIADAVASSIPASIPRGYQFGWLKQTPTVTTTANSKIQISGEYWLELWSTWIYASAI